MGRLAQVFALVISTCLALTMYGGIVNAVEQFGVPWFLAVWAGILLLGLPIIDGLIAAYGAVHAWHWTWQTALLVMLVAPLAMIPVCIGAIALYEAGQARDERNNEKERRAAARPPRLG